VMDNIKTKPVAHSYEPEIFNRQSAEVVVPILLDKFDISSVVDVGCGIATWLAVWRDLGVVDYLGIDSEYVDINKLEIDKSYFQIANLENFEIPARKFDICVSLEVAEHLSESVANSFIEALTGLSDIVLFSSAIPGQTGQHHVNLQWPSYWADKFEQRGYRCCDFVRPIIKTNDKVDWWYQQNILVFLNDNIELDVNAGTPHSHVHLKQYQKVLERLEHFQRAEKRSLLQKIKDHF